MIPHRGHAVWKKIIQNTDEIPFHFLPTRMMLMRVKMMNKSGSPEAFESSLDSMISFFSRNESIIPEDISMLEKTAKDLEPSGLHTVEEIRDLITQGKFLLISGTEALLRKLPQGHWIGGTIPYFMTEAGGLSSEDRLHVNVMDRFVQSAKIQIYHPDDIHKIPQDYPANGMSFLIIPAFSKTHFVFAEQCSSWTGVFERPLVGWVSGTNLSKTTEEGAKVFNGATGEALSEGGVAMHITLDADIYAKVGFINLFEQGPGDLITFPNTGFEVNSCLVNGKEANFADYLLRSKINTELPLVASYMGEMINVSIREVDKQQGKVKLYAPVFESIEYRFANPVGDYPAAFKQQLKKHQGTPVFSCNCILNYLYAQLEGKKTAHFQGPMTFGEIAYMLLNQTLIYVTLEKK